MMTNYETLLKLIETVSPDDTAKLDEIDARVWCEYEDYVFKGIRYPRESKPTVIYTWGDIIDTERAMELSKIKEYTRDRNALKEIRPSVGRLVTITQWSDGWIFTWFPKSVTRNRIASPALPTEELAELHAIIQAINYERGVR